MGEGWGFFPYKNFLLADCLCKNFFFKVQPFVGIFFQKIPFTHFSH